MSLSNVDNVEAMLTVCVDWKLDMITPNDDTWDARSDESSGRIV